MKWMKKRKNNESFGRSANHKIAGEGVEWMMAVLTVIGMASAAVLMAITI